MISPLSTWRQWRVSDALDRGAVPRRAGVFEDHASGLTRFQAGLRELDRRLSDPARTPIMDAPEGLGERVMREVESRTRRPRTGSDPRGFVLGPVFGSWQRMVGVALAAGLALAAMNWPHRTNQPTVFEESPALAANSMRAPSPELALAGTGQALVRLILGGPSAVVPSPIAPTVLEGTREMGERAVAALERIGQERAEPARVEREHKDSGSGRSNRRPGEPELKSNDVMPGVMLAMQVVSRLT